MPKDPNDQYRDQTVAAAEAAAVLQRVLSAGVAPNDCVPHAYNAGGRARATLSAHCGYHRGEDCRPLGRSDAYGVRTFALSCWELPDGLLLTPTGWLWRHQDIVHRGDTTNATLRHAVGDRRYSTDLARLRRWADATIAGERWSPDVSTNVRLTYALERFVAAVANGQIDDSRPADDTDNGGRQVRTWYLATATTTHTVYGADTDHQHPLYVTDDGRLGLAEWKASSGGGHAEYRSLAPRALRGFGFVALGGLVRLGKEQGVDLLDPS